MSRPLFDFIKTATYLCYLSCPLLRELFSRYMGELLFYRMIICFCMSVKSAFLRYDNEQIVYQQLANRSARLKVIF